MKKQLIIYSLISIILYSCSPINAMQRARTAIVPAAMAAAKILQAHDGQPDVATAARKNRAVSKNSAATKAQEVSAKASQEAQITADRSPHWKVLLSAAISAGSFSDYRAYASENKEQKTTLRDYNLAKDWKFLIGQCKKNAYEFDEDSNCNRSFRIMLQRSVSMDNCTTKVLVKDEQTIGFVSYFQVPYLQEVGFLQYLSVTKENRRQGCGNEMVHHAIADLEGKGCTMIVISIKSNNKASRQLFEKNGFKFYYEDSSGNMLLTRNYDPVLMKIIGY